MIEFIDSKYIKRIDCFRLSSLFLLVGRQRNKIGTCNRFKAKLDLQITSPIRYQDSLANVS